MSFDTSSSTFCRRSSTEFIDHFPALEAQRAIHSLFITRCPQIDVQADKEIVLQRLAAYHKNLLIQNGITLPIVTAQQVHGNAVTIVDSTTLSPVPDADGLVTNDSSICLSIYVADCAAVYLFDPMHQAIGLVHSGKKGTELGIVPEAIRLMQMAYRTNPADLILQISPCIRPPHYEIDFASIIARSARELGVKKIYDCNICTAKNIDRYYSYRVEKGKTGRMLAALCLSSQL